MAKYDKRKFLNSGLVQDLIGNTPGVGSIFRSLLGKYFEMYATGRDRELAEINQENTLEQMHEDEAIQTRMMDKYYTLPAQMSQAHEAGINPMVLFGNGASVTSASGASGSSTAAGGGSADPLSAISGLLNLGIRKREADAGINLTNEEAEGKRIENVWKDRLLEQQYIGQLLNNEYTRQNITKLMEDTRFARIYATYAPRLFDAQLAVSGATTEEKSAIAAEARSRVNLNDKQVQELDEKIKNHQKLRQKMDAEIMKINQECLTLASQAYLDDALTSEAYQRIEESEKRVEQIGKQMGLTQLEIDYYKWNHARKYTVDARVGASAPGGAGVSVGGSKDYYYSPE